MNLDGAGITELVLNGKPVLYTGGNNTRYTSHVSGINSVSPYKDGHEATHHPPIKSHSDVRWMVNSFYPDSAEVHLTLGHASEGKTIPPHSPMFETVVTLGDGSCLIQLGFTNHAKNPVSVNPGMQLYFQIGEGVQIKAHRKQQLNTSSIAFERTVAFSSGSKALELAFQDGLKLALSMSKLITHAIARTDPAEGPFFTLGLSGGPKSAHATHQGIIVPPNEKIILAVKISLSR